MTPPATAIGQPHAKAPPIANRVRAMVVNTVVRLIRRAAFLQGGGVSSGKASLTASLYQ